MRHSFLPCLALLLCLPLTGRAQPSQEKKNWFDDPFFQVSAGQPDCPVPLGPLLTFEEQRREAHWRAERGTSCWLAGQCRDSNAYRYDKDLAAPVAAALKAVPGIESGSVWVVIQRRWVFLQGCVGTPGLMCQLERAAQAVPEVETVVPMLQLGTSETPRYPTADKP
ncbi:MAG: BON domain-containing protein [Pseudomonadota bacterium]